MCECFKCGISENESYLFDMVSEKGIVKICRKCSYEEDMPIIRKPSSYQIKKPELESSRNIGDYDCQKKTTQENIIKNTFRKGPESKRLRVYERLSRMSGINSEEHKERIAKKENKVLKEQEVSLKNIVERNLSKNFKRESSKSDNLADNFHWIIMRARRFKKLTQKQLAKEIAEPETTIKMIEQGILQKENYNLLDKLEKYLGIKIMKETEKEVKREHPHEMDFDPITTKTLTISDLQEMKKQKEFEAPDKGIKEESEISDENIEHNKEKDLSKKEVDDLIFGR